MQVPAPLEYERATSVDHAIGLLERLGGSARLLAGGHSLLPMMKLRLANPEYLIDINELHGELGYIRMERPDPYRRDDPAPRVARVGRARRDFPDLP
ncbi:FAD binding domain-containing protein [Streptosporangium lutulentum]